jgi:hypothetical protein
VIESTWSSRSRLSTTMKSPTASSVARALDEVREAQDRQLLQVRHVWQIAHQVVVSHLVVSVQHQPAVTTTSQRTRVAMSEEPTINHDGGREQQRTHVRRPVEWRVRASMTGLVATGHLDRLTDVSELVF